MLQLQRYAPPASKQAQTLKADSQRDGQGSLRFIGSNKDQLEALGTVAKCFSPIKKNGNNFQLEALYLPDTQIIQTLGSLQKTFQKMPQGETDLSHLSFVELDLSHPISLQPKIIEVFGKLGIKDGEVLDTKNNFLHVYSIFPNDPEELADPDILNDPRINTSNYIRGRTKSYQETMTNKQILGTMQLFKRLLNSIM
jgi:hypothetical protein